MFKNIENLNITNISKGVAKRAASITSRKSNSFILRTGGTVRYNFPHKALTVKTGEIIFVPKGSTYNYETLSDVPGEYICINFNADVDSPVPTGYPFEGFQDADEFINTISELWRFGNQADHYRCYALFYNLLAYIENLQRQTYAHKRKSNIIAPAISYLKKHIYDSDLKTETLHELCGVSGTYFRKIFYANYGTSPQKYILSRRLSHAKAVINNGDFETITEVALCVGYNDPLYFSRAFKKKYGVSPSQYLHAAID